MLSGIARPTESITSAVKSVEDLLHVSVFVKFVLTPVCHVVIFKQANCFSSTVRTTETAMEACALLESNPSLGSYMGHKGRPLNAPFPNFSWQNHLLPDQMHNLANVCKMILRVLVGHSSAYGALYSSWGVLTDYKHRAECELLGVFPRVWNGAGGDLPWRLNGLEHSHVCIIPMHTQCLVPAP